MMVDGVEERKRQIDIESRSLEESTLAGKGYLLNASHKASTEKDPPVVSKSVLSSKMLLTERQEMIRIISNRLFVALSLLVGTFVIGGLLIWNGMITVGATNWMVMLCGALGGFVSVQRRLKKLASEDLVLLARSWVYVLLSPLVGAILASLLFFLFVSGLLDGDLFPDFISGGGESTNVGILSLFAVYGQNHTDYAKLIFWCFLAGYSETFVTNIISNFESSADRGSGMNKTT